MTKILERIEREVGVPGLVALLAEELSPTDLQSVLLDGGAVNWTQKLLSNTKERCVISGIGSERMCSAFASLPTQNEEG